MKLNNKRGISLIVLAITIIVMIILAAAIILSLQSSGIIGRANEAKSKTDVANAKQVVAMAEAEWKLDEQNLRKKYDVETFKEYANKKLTEAGYKAEGNGGISLSDAGAINTIYIDSKGKQAIIPEGFTVSNVSTEKTIEGGLVIIDEKGNEFVWVPVNNINEFARMNWDSANTTFEDTYSEPFSKTTEESVTLSLTKDLTGEWAEYNAMRASVEENKGFYIGRYETGTTVKREGREPGTTDVLVQKNRPVYDYVGWGPDMISTTGKVLSNDRNYGKGAVELSRDMYKNSSSVVSTLCYGVQWDATLKFMATNEKNAGYLENSDGKGHFCVDVNWEQITDTLFSILTGTVDEYSVNNIYDMAGNVEEWTMEAANNNKRVMRGNNFGFSGTFPVSTRAITSPDIASDSCGFRIALYLK